MSVDRDATTTPVPDATTVRAALRALIDQLLQAVLPVLRAVMVAVPALRAAMVPLRAAMVPLRVVMVPRRVVTVIAVMVVIRSVTARLAVTVQLLPAVTEQLRPAVRAATRSEMALLVVMTGAPVDEASRNALAPVVIARTARAMIVRAVTIPSSPKRSRRTICTHRRATS